MLDISNAKLVRIIFLAREYGPESRHLYDYISGLNDDEKVSLVAVMWVGRESFEPENVAEALETARIEKTAPTEAYLSGNPDLPDLLEAGMEALGLDVTETEERM